MYGWCWSPKRGGLKADLEGGVGGCLCTIKQDKAIIVLVHCEEQRGLLPGKKELFHIL